MATHPWPLVPHITSHTSLGVAWWWFAYPVRPGAHLQKCINWTKDISVYGLHPKLIRPLSWDGHIPREEAVVAISLGFDATNIPQHLQVHYSHKAIVGGVYLNHFIDISG